LLGFLPENKTINIAAMMARGTMQAAQIHALEAPDFDKTTLL
jgi:hypothetical protein